MNEMGYVQRLKMSAAIMVADPVGVEVAARAGSV